MLKSCKKCLILKSSKKTICNRTCHAGNKVKVFGYCLIIVSCDTLLKYLVLYLSCHDVPLFRSVNSPCAANARHNGETIISIRIRAYSIKGRSLTEVNHFNCCLFRLIVQQVLLLVPSEKPNPLQYDSKSKCYKSLVETYLWSKQCPYITVFLLGKEFGMIINCTFTKL